MTRIKVRNLASGAVLDMEFDPDATAQEIVKRAAAFWGEDPSDFVLRRAGEVLGSSTTLVEAGIEEDDVLEFLPGEESRKVVLLLMFPDGRSLRVWQNCVLGREDLKPFLEKPEHASLISSRHVSVSYHDGAYAVEDGAGGQPSRNGTTLNGQDIRGQGRFFLRERDMLGMARVLTLTVRLVRGK